MTTPKVFRPSPSSTDAEYQKRVALRDKMRARINAPDAVAARTEATAAAHAELARRAAAVAAATPPTLPTGQEPPSL